MERGAYSFSYVGPKCSRCDQGFLLCLRTQHTLRRQGPRQSHGRCWCSVALQGGKIFLVKEGEIMAHVECTMTI